MPELAQIIRENEALIYKGASYFRGYGNIDDLFQAGCMGMVDAYQKFDSSRGVKFTTYAYSFILGEMKALVRQDKSVKVSRDVSRLRGKIEEVRDMLSQQFMRQPTTFELSEYLEIPEFTIDEALSSKVTMRSIDENVGDTNMMLHEVISMPGVDQNDLLYLKTELENLGEPERTIMIQRYYEDMTQSEIASNLGLSQVAVSRKEGKVLTHLRQSIN